MKLVLASGNQGKVQEFNSLLNPIGMEVVPQSELGIAGADETGLTFVENAILKARHASRMSGLPALADDSGIAIDILGGKPGIYSARYAGNDQANIERVLQELEGVVDINRGAQFHCALVYMRHADDPCPLICHGEWAGKILNAPQGESGFGYDPIFWVEEHQCSAAELSREQKNQISHRGQAIQQLLSMLSKLGLT